MASDGSFNPLTYKVDMADDTNLELEASLKQEESRRGSDCTLVGEKEEEMMDTDTLTGMLRFVNQTLAKQEDPSVWSSTRQSEPDHAPPSPR